MVNTIMMSDSDTKSRLNLELKAHYPNERGHSQAKRLTIHKNLLVQTDTYFNVKSDCLVNARLKLRKIDKGSDVSYELIYYSRPDQTDAKHSKYKICNVIDGEVLLDILTNTLGVLVVVEKKRTVYLYKNSRIHIDNVRNLGQFIEFEVVYPCVCENDGQTEDEAKQVMQELYEHFDIDNYGKLCKGSYSDLLMRQNE